MKFYFINLTMFVIGLLFSQTAIFADIDPDRGVDHEKETQIQDALKRAQALGTREEIQSHLDEMKSQHTKKPQAAKRPSRGRAAAAFIMLYLADKDDEGNFLQFSSAYLTEITGGAVPDEMLKKIGAPILKFQKDAANRQEQQLAIRCSFVTNGALSDEVAIKSALLNDVNPAWVRSLVFEDALDQLIAVLPYDASVTLENGFADYLSKAVESQSTLIKEPYYLSIAGVLRPILELGCYGAGEKPMGTREETK